MITVVIVVAWATATTLLESASGVVFPNMFSHILLHGLDFLAAGVLVHFSNK